MEPDEDELWDRLVADLQRDVEEQERALYSATVLEQAHNPKQMGPMEAPDAMATLAVDTLRKAIAERVALGKEHPL